MSDGNLRCPLDCHHRRIGVVDAFTVVVFHCLGKTSFNKPRTSRRETETNQELLDEKRKQTKLMEKQFGPLTNNPETFSDEKSRQDFDDQVVANRRKGELGFFILIGGLILFVIVVGFIFSLMGN